MNLLTPTFLLGVNTEYYLDKEAVESGNEGNIDRADDEHEEVEYNEHGIAKEVQDFIVPSDEEEQIEVRKIFKPRYPMDVFQLCRIDGAINRLRRKTKRQRTALILTLRMFPFIAPSPFR